MSRSSKKTASSTPASSGTKSRHRSLPPHPYKGHHARAQAPTQAATHHSTLDEAATAQALLKGLTQAAASAAKSASNHPPSPAISKKKKRSRSPYKCHKCGKPKKGHICTILPSPALLRGRENRLISPSPTPLSPPSSHQPVQLDYFDPPSSPPVQLSQRSLAEGSETDEGEENYLLSTSSVDLAAMFPVPAATTTTTTTTTPAPTTTNTTATTITTSIATSGTTTATLAAAAASSSPLNTSFASLGDLGEAVLWNSTDALFTDSTDDDWAALGYIDERFPIGGVGVNLNSKKKVPFFVSWFEMAYGGLDMLATFLKTQRPSWPPLQEVLEDLEAEKQKLNIWKEDFDKNVIKRVLADHEPTTAVPTSVILGGNPNREVIEVEDSQNSSQESQDNLSQSSSNKMDHTTDQENSESQEN